MSNSAKLKAAQAESRRLTRCLNDVVDDYAKGIIKAAANRAKGDAAKMPAMLGEFIRDEATAFGDKLHQRITELLHAMAAKEREEEPETELDRAIRREAERKEGGPRP